MELSRERNKNLSHLTPSSPEKISQSSGCNGYYNFIIITLFMNVIVSYYHFYTSYDSFCVSFLFSQNIVMRKFFIACTYHAIPLWKLSGFFYTLCLDLYSYEHGLLFNFQDLSSGLQLFLFNTSCSLAMDTLFF